MGLTIRIFFIPSYALVCIVKCDQDAVATTCFRVRVNGGSMDAQFYLNLADIRLRQTWGLLHHMNNKHQDSEALRDAMDAISTARDVLKTLKTP